MSVDFDYGIGYGELDLERFIRFLIDTGNDSLEDETLPDRKTLQHAVDRLGQLHHTLDETGGLSPAQLFLLAVYAFEIGAHGTASKNTEGYIRAVDTAAGRSKMAEKHAPDELRIQKAIAEAEKKAGGRGWKKTIARELSVSAKTVSRHLKKNKRTS
jgi:hypothetical protein